MMSTADEIELLVPEKEERPKLLLQVDVQIFLVAPKDKDNTQVGPP